MIAELLRLSEKEGTRFEFEAIEMRNELISLLVPFDTLHRIHPRLAQKLKQNGYSQAKAWMTISLPHGDYELLRIHGNG